MLNKRFCLIATVLECATYKNLEVAMSALHRTLFPKTNRGHSLATLLEDPTNSTVADTSSSTTAGTLREPCETENDSSLIDNFHEIKNRLFPIQEKYKCPKGQLIQTYYAPSKSAEAPILIFHHGAGSSAMTFCLLAQYIQNENSDASPGIFLFDALGHGGSSSRANNDYSLDAMTENFHFVIDQFSHQHVSKSEKFLIGHSLGGAILTNFISKYNHSSYNIKGLTMIDIVEETAIKALRAMPTIISKRPLKFNSYHDAIKWHLNSSILCNESSARISVCDLLKKNRDGLLVWKTDLNAMSSSWATWFVDLSNAFINCDTTLDHKVAKLLILSGNDILDKNLIIGQMQGKYQLIVFNNCSHSGHFLQEDIPRQLAISILDFVRRYDRNQRMSNARSGVANWGGEIRL